MADQVQVLTVCGSFRKGSFNAALMRALPGLAPAGMNLRPSPPIEKLPLYNFDLHSSTGFPAEVMAFANAVRAADGVIIVSPEYNWSIPAGLKNAIDWCSRMKEDEPFKGKPVALQSCAAGLLGGARMQLHLRQTLTSIEALIFIRPEVYITFSAKKFDEKTLELTDQPARDMAKAQLEGFEKFVRKIVGKN